MMAVMESIGHVVEGFTPAHADLPRSAGVPALLASQSYVEALARVVYYWGYPGVESFGRTNMWQMMDDEAGTVLGILPAGPKNHTGGLSDYMSSGQRLVVTPNHDTFHGAGFADLTTETAVIQTPTDVPDGHYWAVQIVDVMTNVVHRLGSASNTPGGKFLLVGPEWSGDKPEGFLDVLRVPTNVAGVFPRSFAGRSDGSKGRARAVLDQIGMYPFSEDQPGRRSFGYEAHTTHAVYPPGVTAELIAANPDARRPQWVNARTFWTDVARMLDFNPQMSESDTPMADQARALVALHSSDEQYRALLDRTALAADIALHDSATHIQVEVDVGNGWHRQYGAGVLGSDWFGRALAAVAYIFVDDYHEAVYLTRATDLGGQILNGRHHYTMTFAKDGLPPVDRSRGGFWSLTMYDKDAFTFADAPLDRVSIGTCSLDADEHIFADDGTLTLHLGHRQPSDPADHANWLPAPADQFCLMIRAYVPTDAILDGSYTFPNVARLAK